MKIAEIAYTEVLGMPIVVWGGITTLTLLIITAAIGWLNTHGKRVAPFKVHVRLGFITIIFGVLHGLLVIASNMGL